MLWGRRGLISGSFRGRSCSWVVGDIFGEDLLGVIWLGLWALSSSSVGSGPSSWIDSVELVELVPVGLGERSCLRLWVAVARGAGVFGSGGDLPAIGGGGMYRICATSKCFAHDVRWSMMICSDFGESVGCRRYVSISSQGV